MGSKQQKSITCFKSHKTLNYTCKNAEGKMLLVYIDKKQ